MTLSIFLKKELKKLNQIENKRIKKILIVAGRTSFSKSGAQKLLEKSLKNKEIRFYFKKNYLPIIKELNLIIKNRNGFKPDLIIAVGGGSVIDLAKISNLVWVDNQLQKNVQKNNLNKIKKKYCKLIVLPTTAGSGAETTSGAVIYIKGIKYSIDSSHVKPDVYVLYPNLHKNIDRKNRASSGLDAISQALESLISMKSNKKSVFFAKKSLKLSFKYFLKSLKKPTDFNLFQMSLAANYAGRAIDISKTTAPHAISYYFTEKHNVSHGHAVFLTLIKFFEYNFLNLNKSNSDFNLASRFNIMIKLSNSKNFFEFLVFLKRIKKETKLEFNFSRLGINLQKNIHKILKEVNPARLANNPVNLDLNTVKKILLN